MKNNEHIEWIDQAKAITILLVVLGHMNIPEKISIIIYSFHMPLFFVLSGILYDEIKYSKNLKTVLIAKTLSLLWPFVTFTIFAIVINILTGHISGQLPLEYLIDSLKMSSTWIRSVNTPLWFLTALFSTELLFSQIIKYNGQKSVAYIILSLLIIGILNLHFWHYSIVFNLHIAFISIIFFLFGWLYNKSKYFSLKISNKQVFTYAVFSFMAMSISALLNQKIDMYDSVYGNFFLFLSASFSGAIFVISISKLTSSLKYIKFIFNYLGKNSLIILAIVSVLVPILVGIVGHMPLRLDRVLSLLLIFLSIELINRYAPFLLKLNIARKYKYI